MDLGSVVRIRLALSAHPLDRRLALAKDDRRLAANSVGLTKGVAADHHLLSQSNQLWVERHAVYKVKTAAATTQEDGTDGGISETLEERRGHADSIRPIR